MFLVLSMGAASLCAQDFREDRFAVRGFGTIAAVTHDTDDVEFRRNTGQSDGAGAGEVEFASDSLLGVQLSAKLPADFDVVVQGVTHQRADGDWVPQLTQGYLRWSPDDSFVVRAGRVGYDIYLLAESRQVGYSYLSARPSPEFYGQISNDDIDGGDLTYKRRIGGGLVRARLFAGAGDGELAFEDGTSSESQQRLVGATLDYLRGGWTARIAMVQISYDAGNDIPLLVAGLRATGLPQAASIANDLDERVYHSFGVQAGVAYDDGPLQAQLLYGFANSDSISGPDFNKVLAEVGYRLDRWTPFVAFATSRDRNPIRTTGLPDLPMFAPLNGAIVRIQEVTRSTQHTATAGVRYDLSSHFDFKLQVDRMHAADTSLLFDRRPDAGSPVDLTVFTASVDFVF
ncbi:MAG TPA: hypothetical protein VMF52_03595 [Steroidobacteraceae bacterium]|nr:hypothetical protein [Steroidobacteraceae bacterium]